MNNKIDFHLQLSSELLRKLLLAIIFLNLFFLAATWYCHTSSIGLLYLLRLLDLQSENVIATWYSSVLLLLTAIASVICFIADQSRFTSGLNRYISHGWLMFAMIFIVLSFDEMGSFHEEIGYKAIFTVPGEALGMEAGSGWTIFDGFIIFTGLIMGSFSLLRLRSTAPGLVFAIIGVLLFLSNRMQEDIEMSAMRSSPDPEAWVRPVGLLLLEEGSEIFGSLCFLLATSLYAISATGRKINTSGYFNGIRVSFKKNRHFVFIALFISLGVLGLFTILSKMYLNNAEGYSRGVPQNWFPSMLAFVNSMILFYNITVGSGDAWRRNAFLWSGIFCLFLSMYYGSHIYSNYLYLWTNTNVRSWVFNITFIAVIAGLAVLQFKSVKKGSGMQLLYTGWLLAVFMSVITFSPLASYAAWLGFLASSVLLVFLVADLSETHQELQLAEYRNSA